MTTLADLIARDGITADVTQGTGEPKGMARTFTVTLRRVDYSRALSYWPGTERQSMSVPFGQGSAHTEDPTALDVLDCLISDAWTVGDAVDFDEWADDFGGDMTTAAGRRAARATWDAIEAQTEELRRFLGDADFRTYMEADRD